MDVGIVGLGLIGGSMAKAIKKNTKYRVFGLDRDALTQEQAQKDGAIDGALSPTQLSACSLLLIALYPRAAADFIAQNAHAFGKGALVVDLCGLKRLVCGVAGPLARKQGFYFVGGHPMRGRASWGYGASDAELFLNASMILTPDAQTPAALLDALKDLFLTLGFGSVCTCTPEEHDGVIAYTSQLAHVLSNAYVKSPHALNREQFTGGSFQDLTRVAYLNPDMWSQLFLLNRDFLADEIDALCTRLSAYSDALRAQDEHRLHALLREGIDYKLRAQTEDGVCKP